jgi:hypothetical protein
MASRKLPLSIAAAVVLGLVQPYFLVACWTFISFHIPFPVWLVGLGLRGTAFNGTLYVADFAINVLLSAPAAFLLLRLRPTRLLAYLAACVIPGFLLLNLNVFASPSLAFIVRTWPQELLALPLAGWLLRRWLPRDPPFPDALSPLRALP